MGSRAFYGLLLAVTMVLVGMVSSAEAAPPPVWSLTMTHNVDPFESGSEPMNIWEMIPANIGKGTVSGPVTFTDVLPPGVKVRSISYGSLVGPGCPTVEEVNAGAPLTCTVDFKTPPTIEGGSQPVPPGVPYASFSIQVEFPAGSPETLTNTATISGGGALAPATATDTVPAIDLPPFHVKKFEAESTRNGVEYTVAGGHQLETLNRFTFPLYPREEMKNAFVKLPAGYFANPAAAPRCPLQDITRFESSDTCPPGSKVGVAGVAIFDQYNEYTIPIYNVIPDKGYPAQFVFASRKLPVLAVRGSAPALRRVRLGDWVDEQRPCRDQKLLRHLLRRPLRTRAGNLGGAVRVEPGRLLGSRTGVEALRRHLGEPGPEPSGAACLWIGSEPAWMTATTTTSPVTGCEDPALASQFDPSLDVKPVQESPAPQSRPAHGPGGQLPLPADQRPDRPQHRLQPRNCRRLRS